MAERRQLSDAEKTDILKRHGMRCFIDSHPIESEDDIEFDHIVPVAAGGTTTLENLAPVCRKHNRQKGTMVLSEYRDYLKLVFTEMNETDKALYVRLGLRERLRPDRTEGMRQGGRASAYDINLVGRWPIPLEQISMKVHLWQAEEDRGVGGMGRYMAARLPNCRATYIPNAGHFWIFEHMGEILDTLVPPTSNSRK